MRHTLQTRLVKSIAAAAMLVAAVISAPHAHGSNDIVYCARYYYPPGGHRFSHAQIYTIDPEGHHRRQLTFGSCGLDDVWQSPLWSPDGKYILFVRAESNSSLVGVWIMDANGHGQREIFRTGPQSDYVWRIPRASWQQNPESVCVIESNVGDQSTTDVTCDLRGRILGTVHNAINAGTDLGAVISPDAKYAYDTFTGAIYDRRRGDRVGATIPAFSAATWIGDDKLAGVTALGSGHEFAEFGIDGKIQRTVLFPFMTTQAVIDQTGERDVDNWYQIQRIPGLKDCYVAAQFINHERSALNFWLDVHKARRRFLASANLCSWSPNARQVCATGGITTANYDSVRVVWIAPLEIVDVPSGNFHVIQGGLVEVHGADWRRGHAAD